MGVGAGRMGKLGWCAERDEMGERWAEGCVWCCMRCVVVAVGSRTLASVVAKARSEARPGSSARHTSSVATCISSMLHPCSQVKHVQYRSVRVRPVQYGLLEAAVKAVNVSVNVSVSVKLSEALADPAGDCFFFRVLRDVC